MITTEKDVCSAASKKTTTATDTKDFSPETPVDKAWNAYIFREGKTGLRGPDLVRELSGRLRTLHQSDISRTELLDLLLRAGELECALKDLDSTHADVGAKITDSVADAVVSRSPLHTDELAVLVRRIDAPEQVQVAPPEGFAYYALHPLDLADLVRAANCKSGFAAVIGIRSIGTTLSAVVQATFRAERVKADRITVRPVGHPYNRTTKFSPEQERWITTMRSVNAQFYVVDEGPGMSGSSFLSVGEALLDVGVSRPAISFLASRRADPNSLTAPNAAARWAGFRAYYTQPTHYLPRGATDYIAGGIWRARAFQSEQDWPASWLQMERLKFLSQDGACLFRFEGFGRFGEDVYRRSTKVAEAGFGPQPHGREEGFGKYPMVNGRYLSASDTDRTVLTQIAEYCAFRARAIPAHLASTPELETMLEFNVKEEFGVELPPHLARLPIERPVIADGRMLPHKWIDTEAQILKVDSATHGDDHFFPGPTDIAWDLAGAIVEWNLNAEAADFLLQAYKTRSGDDAAERLAAYRLAYGIFRCAYCKMAAAASAGMVEYHRLRREYLYYREQARVFVTGQKP
ncbi:MAG TPA: hypothetical protein VMU28_04285 [Terriglobales bacterium]|nr:hypothetical protein [Terriglobales bacterium]